MINHTITVLIELTQNLPVGTNLALLHFLWMLVSGALLPQRGALFPALQATGLSPEAVRRAWPLSAVGLGRSACSCSVGKPTCSASPAGKYIGIKATV
jgi:hypothetical protein